MDEEGLPPVEKTGEESCDDPLLLDQDVLLSRTSSQQQEEVFEPFLSKQHDEEDPGDVTDDKKEVRWDIDEKQQHFSYEHFDRFVKMEKQFQHISSMSLSLEESVQASQLLDDHSKDIHHLKTSVVEIDDLKTSVREIKDKKKKSGRLSRDVYSMMFFIPRGENQRSNKTHIFAYTFLVFLLQVSIQTFILVDLLDYPDNKVWPNPPKDVTPVVRLSQFFACVLALIFQDDLSVSLSDMQCGYEVIFKDTIDNNNNGIKDLMDRLFFWLPCIAKFLTGVQSLIVSLVIILQSDELIDLFQNFAAMAFVSTIDNIGFALADFGYFNAYIEEQAKKVSSHRYDSSLVEYKWGIIRPITVVNLCIILPLLGVCGHVTNLQRSGAMFCRTLTLRVSDNRNAGDLSHWGVYVFEGSRIHGRPLYIEESCDFDSPLLYPNLCGFLAYCGRTQRWSFILGTKGAKDDFKNNCHNQYWFPEQSVPPNPIIQTHYFISGESSSFSVLDANEWHEIDSDQSGVKTVVDSFRLSCKDCSSSEDCNGGDCSSATRRCHCNSKAFGMMCQETVYPCEEINFEHGVNLGDFSHVDVHINEREIVNFVNPTYTLMRLSSSRELITFNERPVYFNYQRYHQRQFTDALILEATSSFLDNQRYWEPLVTNGTEQVLVISYYSGGKWNFVTPLSLVGVDQAVLLQNKGVSPLGSSSELNFQEFVRHMFHFHSKNVNMGFRLEQLREWKIISTKATEIPVDISSEKRYQLLSDFSPTWYQLENIALTLKSGGSNKINSTDYLSCAGCAHTYSDMCRFPTKFCDEKKGVCVNLAKMFPECSTTRPQWVLNGRCDSTEYGLNTEECGFDGGDCIDFNKKYPNCKVAHPYWIGSGRCSGGEYNVKECGYGGGDCEWYNANFTREYPDCTAEMPFAIRNGFCNNLYPYNSIECGYDGGDCLHSQYPECVEINPEEIGDGECHIDLDRKECGWDGGDCIIIPKYPACRGNYVKDYVGNGICEPFYFNTEACGWDGGDCEDHNLKLKMKYPLCEVEEPSWLGNGFCNGNLDKGGAYNSAECGWDDGDCLDFNDEYPDCDVPNPWQVGNTECNSYYNKEECGWDGGDCDPIPNSIEEFGE